MYHLACFEVYRYTLCVRSVPSLPITPSLTHPGIVLFRKHESNVYLTAASIDAKERQNGQEKAVCLPIILKRVSL